MTDPAPSDRTDTSGLPSRDKVLERLRASSRGPLKPKELARALDVPTHDYKRFKGLLGEMEGDGTLYRVKGGRYAVPEKINLTVGRLQVIRSGDGFVVPDDEDRQDVFVPSSSLESAMDGDQVVVRIEGRPKGRQPRGRVIKVLDRAHATMVGTYHRSEKFGYVAPQDQKLGRDVMIPQGDEQGATDGDAVVVRISSFGDRKLNPVGEVTRVLGPIDDPGVDVLLVIHGHGLPLEFPPEIDEAAETAAARTPEVAGREDRTDLLVFTIDPADARDHDDALSVVEQEKGVWEVGIHIADVSHYVDLDGPVDLEALNRGTSVYLVDRVVPMLPEVLSSDVCSLRPDEDRAAVSLFLTLDEEARVRDHRFERTLIRSRHRFSYEDVQEGRGRLRGPGDRRRDPDPLRPRPPPPCERSGLDFDLPEGRVILGEEGEPVDIQKVNRLESHRLIEDFMLLANETVARRATDAEIPLLYRIHEAPDQERMEELREFLASVGNTLPRGKVRPKDLQKVLERVEGRPEQTLISTAILRSMTRARYDPENAGHFGLAADHYAHFTSPIRRYPDLMVHRIVVRAFVEGRPIPEEWSGERLEAIAERTSAQERVADEAERDSVELKKVEFMERHLGDELYDLRRHLLRHLSSTTSSSKGSSM